MAGRANDLKNILEQTWKLMTMLFSHFDINSEEEGITKIWHNSRSTIYTQCNKEEKFKKNQWNLAKSQTWWNFWFKNGPIIFIFYLKSGRFLSEDIELEI